MSLLFDFKWENIKEIDNDFLFRRKKIFINMM